MDNQTRKRDATDFLAYDDDDDMFITNTTEDIVGLDDFFRSKEQHVNAVIHSKKLRTAMEEEVVDSNASDSEEPLFLKKTQRLSNNTAATNEDVVEELAYPESPPSRSGTDAMDIDTAGSLFDGENEESPLMQIMLDNIKGKEHLFPTPLFGTDPSAQAGPSRPRTLSTNLPVPPKPDYSKPPSSGSFVVAICPNTGSTLYFPKSVQPTRRTKSEAAIKRVKKTAHLLEKPIWKLLVDIENDNKLRLLQRQEEREAETKRSKKKKPKAIKTEYLWVEKYKPKVFLDLLGDQRVNRDVLRWVKQWDYCVFGKQPPQESQRDKIMKKYKDTFGNTTRFDGKLSDMERPKDSLLRPDKRIMLISGPPGFGKTTLAHIVGKHAGYNIIEVNASDDRTSDVVATKIKSALEMQAIIRGKTPENGTKGSTTKMQQKPNILIIDEIDGASSGGGGEGFIQQLIQLATAESSEKTQTSKRGGKAKKKTTPLMRPIICICNDAYAPVLRPLRAIAYNIQFRKVPALSIATRLQEICEYEGLQSDLRALSLLSDSTEGDIRSCLNTLQFIRGRSTTFTRDMLEASIGKKDMGTSLFSVWEGLFSEKPASKKGSMTDDTYKSSKYFGRLLEAVMTNGEMEKIMQGCFESFPHMRFHDVGLRKVVHIHDWLNFYDHVNHRVNSSFEYGLFGYLPFPLVNFHRFFASPSIQEHRIEYPKIDYESFVRKKSFENLVHVFVSGIHIERRRFMSKNIITSELVPRLLRIISPELRPVNKQVIKPAEKAVLQRLVQIMIEFGLTFLQEKSDDGQFVYKLEPPVEQLVLFDSTSNKGILPNKYAVRQLVSQEIEAELIRRREEAANARTIYRTQPTKEKMDEDMVQKLNIHEAEKVATDFFGRVITPKVAQGDATAMEVDTPETTVSYRYHEGFSNAVKKPMTVQMFL